MSLSTLRSLPFHPISNIELLDTLESIESKIRQTLENNNFPKFISSLLADNDLFERNCKYYTSEEYSCLFKKEYRNLSGIKIIHHNIRSLDAHFGKLLALIKSLQNDIDFIALSEIGKNNIENRAMQLEKHGYKMKYEKSSLSKGGTGLMYKADIDLIERDDLKLNPVKLNGSNLVIENIWYETNFKNSKDNYIIGVIYKHPGCSVECLDNFTDQLKTSMSKVNKERKKCVITGDINIDGLHIDKNMHVNKFYRATIEQGFIPTITLPTRIVETKAATQISLIDQIFTNFQTFKDNKSIYSGNIFSDISDHLPNFLNIHSYSKKNILERPIIRIYGEKNTNKFKKLLQEANWDELLSATDENIALNIFYNIYNVAFNKAFPLKRLSRNRARDKEWITSEIKQNIHHKNRLFKKSLLHPTPSNRKKYTIFRNILNRKIRLAEDNYYKNLLSNGSQNLFKLWNIFGKIINPNKHKCNKKIAKLKCLDKVIENDKDIANALNDYFCNIGEQMAESHTNDTSTFTKYLDESNKNSFFLSPTTYEEVLKEIKKLNPKKSGGADNLSPGLLKSTANVLSTPITHIINLSFQNSRVPDMLKLAKVIPIYKKNEKYLTKNYRPISLLSTINKIMEKIMYRQIISFLTKHSILYAYQFGFRENHSTAMALIEIVDNIYQELENGKYVAGIYLDISKAFDTVDHSILLYKLEHYGIRGEPLEWFKSYLTNRKQFTVVNNQQSSTKNIKYGVPQGSVLGPLLFLIYTNDIVNCTKEKNLTRLFADDANSFLSRDTPEELKRSMTIILKDFFKWCSDNKLTVNIDKTCYTVFKTRRKEVPSFLNNIKVDNITIPKVSSANYLGVILDESLTWEEHINNLVKTLISTANSFKVIKNKVRTENKRTLYHAYIYSKIQYGIEVYGRATQTLLKRVQTQQNRALKILYRLDYLTPTIKLHTDLNLLLVKDIYKCSIAKFVYKQQNNLLPNIFNKYIIKNTNIHNYNTRQMLHVPHITKQIGKYKTEYQGVVIWNALPKNIVQSKSVKGFHKKIKKYVIKQYKI